jgi:gliding motility-associated-like protein
LNNPIQGVHVKFATVENDARVRIEWEKSKEPDFKEYELYRFPRNGVAGKIPFTYSTDTIGKDSSFNVDLESWCYSIIVTDKCGHTSKQSNQACNVIINGSANGRPNYSFDLYWQNYQDWAYGVQEWNLERQYATNPWTLVANTGKNRKQRDSLLDYDWGGYWYRVTATEQLKGQNRQPYQSQSNWIYLVQPPELWVPNAFTPNENGLNDVWGTVPVFVRNYNMKVYNRWGQKVWESTAKKLQWDGTVDGKLAEDGVFAWYVVFDGWNEKTYRMKGTVTVIH